MPPPRRVAPVLLLLVLACQTPKPLSMPRTAPTAGPQVLRVAVAALPSTLDPALAPIYDSGASRLMFETLAKPKSDLSDVTPAAAIRWTVGADGVTYDFTIRPHEGWSTGKPVRAADFVYAWRRLLDPRVNSPAAEVLAPLIKGAGAYPDLDPKRDAARIPAFLDGLAISAVDDATFRVVLDHPSAEFLWAVTMPATAPELAGDTRAGNGPFRIAGSGPDHLDFEPNEFYGGAHSPLARIVLFTRGDASADVERFARGEEELTTVSGATAGAAQQDPRLKDRLTRTPALEVWWLQFNVHRAPFDRPGVRLAIARAVDREALLREVLDGVGIPAVGLIPAGMQGYRPGLAAQRFDPAAARAALAASGASAGELASVHMLVRDLQPDRRVAEFVAAQVRANLGLTISLDVVASPAVTKKLATGDFQVAGPAGWIADLPDPQDLLDLFLNEVFRGQASRYHNPAYDKLVAAGDGEVNLARRLQDYAEAEQLLGEDAPVAFLYQPEVLTLRRSSVSGLTTTPLDDWPGDLFAAEISLTKAPP